MQIEFLVETQHIVQLYFVIHHVVSGRATNGFYRIGIRIVVGCEVLDGMLGF